MAYKSNCAANPLRTVCVWECPCQGHYKVYPNQPCQCSKSTAKVTETSTED